MGKASREENNQDIYSSMNNSNHSNISHIEDSKQVQHSFTPHNSQMPSPSNVQQFQHTTHSKSFDTQSLNLGKYLMTLND